MSTRDRLLAVFVAVLWGVNFLAIHYALDGAPPLLLAALRYVVLAIPVLLFVRRPDVPWRWLIGFGLGFGTGQFVFLFTALEIGMPTGLASLVLQTSAPFTVLLAALLLRERLAARQVIGIVVALLGVAVIAWQRAQVAAVLPVLLTVAGGLSWAVGNLCSRKAAAREPMRLVLWSAVVPPLPLLAMSAFVEGPTAIVDVIGGLGSASWTVSAGFAYLVVFGTLVGGALWTGLMRRYDAGIVAPYSLLVPVVGMSAAWLVLGERRGPVELIAAGVVVVGVLLGTPRANTRPPLVSPGDDERSRTAAARVADQVRSG